MRTFIGFLNGRPYFDQVPVGTLYFADGTAALPSISFAADPDTGFYRLGANQIGFASGGQGFLNAYWDGTNAVLREPTNNASLYLAAAGGCELAANGTAKNITLTPSTTGGVRVNGNSGGNLFGFRVSNSGGNAIAELAASAKAIQILTTASGDIGFYSNAAAAGTIGTLAMTLGADQVCTHAAGVVFSTLPTVTAATYTLLATDNNLIFNRAGTVTVTLGTATNGRRVCFRTITANTVVSASSNVVPIAGGAAGTAILAATAGKYAVLIGDGTNWQIQEAN